MQFKQMLLMCSALITVAYSFPTNKQINTESIHRNDTNLLDAKESERPLVIIMEEKNPNTDSVVVQFVYSSNGGNSIIQTTGKEKDKYVIESSVKEENNIKSNENYENKSVHVSSTQETIQRYNNEIKSEASKVQISPLTALVPQEETLLTVNWPKYFYDSFNPVKPFPELQIQKSNQIITNKIAKEKNETYLLTTNRRERKEIPYVAGPQLNPLSIYDREFYVPIFA